MHYHVTEAPIGDCPRALGSDLAINYPSRRPAFSGVGTAIEAVMSSAFDQWGTAAEVAVEFEMLLEISQEREAACTGALAGWVAPDGDGAMWSLHACDCADGVLAELFST